MIYILLQILGYVLLQILLCNTSKIILCTTSNVMDNIIGWLTWMLLFFRSCGRRIVLCGSRKKAHWKKRSGNKHTRKMCTGKKRIRKRAHAEKSSRGIKRSRKKAQIQLFLTDHTFYYCRISLSYKCKYENVCYLINNFSLSSKRENKSKTTGVK